MSIISLPHEYVAKLDFIAGAFARQFGHRPPVKWFVLSAIDIMYNEAAADLAKEIRGEE